MNEEGKCVINICEIDEYESRDTIKTKASDIYSLGKIIESIQPETTRSISLESLIRQVT